VGGTRFVAIDVETTGVDAEHDEVTELAAVRLDGTATWSSLVRTKRGGPSTQHDHAPEFVEVAAQFLALLAADGVVVVSHNVEFDLRFVSQALGSCGAQVPGLVTLDTREAAWVLLGDEGTLEELCEDYGVEHTGAHTALSDASSTAGLLAHLLSVADEHGLGTDWLPLVQREGPRLAECGLLPPTVEPLARDLELWPPAVHPRRGRDRLEIAISADDFPSVEAATVRDALRELADDPGREPSKRAEIERVLALADAELLDEVARRMESYEPDDEELLADRVLEASMGGGLVQQRALEDLLDEVRGTRFEPEVVTGVFEARMGTRDLRGQADAVIEYLAEPSADQVVATANAASVLFDAVKDARLDLAAEIIAAHPKVLEARNSSGTLADQLRTIPHSLVSHDRAEDALRVAAWACTLTYDDATIAGLRGVQGHVIERSGDPDHALQVLLDDWDHGVRSSVHADRLSLLASRAGDKDTARRVLAEALEDLELTDTDRETLAKRLVRLR